MKHVIIFLLKIFCSLIAMIEAWQRMIIALILWDAEVIKQDWMWDAIWKSKKP